MNDKSYNPSYELRDYQNLAVLKLHQSTNANINSIFCSPTGTGKTKTAIKYIYDRTTLKEIIFILVPQVEIFNQWLFDLNDAGLSSITGYINDKGVFGKNKKIYVIMPMSLIGILSRLPEKFKPDEIITDEAHRSEAATWQTIYNFYSGSKKIGLTATPKRSDGKGLDNTYDKIIETITMQEAIENGFLAQPLLIVPEEYKLKIPIQNGDFSLEKQAEALGKTKIIGNVIENYGKYFNGHQCMVACTTFEHAATMTENFNKSGWNFKHIHSNLNFRERSKILRDLKAKKIDGICTVGIGIEGLDIPGLYGLIWLRRTMSITIYLQFIGRVLRPLDGKKYGLILDFVGNCFLHGRPEMKRKWSLIGDNNEIENDDIKIKMKICPCCNVMNAELNIFCHICNYDFRSPKPEGTGRKIPTIVDGSLVLLDDIEIEQREAERKAEIEKEKLLFGTDSEEYGLNDGGRPGENKEAGEPIEISRMDKFNLLKTGLEKNKKIFNDTLKDFL